MNLSRWMLRVGVAVIGMAVGASAVLAEEVKAGSAPAPATDVKAPAAPKAEAAKPEVKAEAKKPAEKTKAESPAAKAAEASLPHEKVLDLGNKITLKLVLIPAGKCMMGEVNRQHEVTISKPFYMGATEVTQEQYELILGANPSKFKGPTNPVEMVTWDEATQCCKKASEKTGQAVRLPTESEWEYAARAGATTTYAFGNDGKDLGEYAWFADNGQNTTHPVGQKKPSAWGLYDIYGNVWELCSDWEADYPSGPVTDPTGPATGSRHALRGGAYDLNGGACRTSHRNSAAPGDRLPRIGFRVVVPTAATAAPAAPAAK